MNFKQCLKLRPAAMKNLQEKYYIAAYLHIENRTGFAKHMSLKTIPA